MKLLRDKIFVTEAEVYNTAYGDLLGNGGSAKFEQAIDHLLEDGRLQSGDTLFLAFDNTMRSFNDSRISYCESCYAVHNLGVPSPDLAKTRLAYLYANSLFQSVFSPLGLRVTTDT